MTTPALTAATGPAGLASGPAGAAAPEGVFAGLLADAAPAAAAAAAPAPVAPHTSPAAGADALLALLEQELQQTVLPDGTLLGAQALGLAAAPLLLPVPLPGTAAGAATDPAADLAAVGQAAPLHALAAAPPASDAQPVGTAAGTPAPATASAADLLEAAPSHGAGSVPEPVQPAGGQTVPPRSAAGAEAAVDPAVAPAVASAVDVATAARPEGARAAATSSGEPVDAAPAAAAEVVEAAADVGAAAPIAEAVEQAAVPVQTAPAQPVAGPAAPATAPAPLEQVAAERGPEQVRPAVAELARGLRDAGGGRASLVVRLDPPELGPVLVRLSVQDGRVDVQLRTSEAVAAVGLGTASADVRSTLLEHGLDLSSFDVASDADSSFSQQLSQGSPDRGTPGRRQGADDREGAVGAGTPTGVITETTDDGTPVGAWL